MNTIFRKEFKDVLRWTPLGMLVIGQLCWQQIPGTLYECNDLTSSIAGSVVIGSSLFALALGLLQSFFDLRTDSRAFLLHRPIETRHIFWGKLAAGFVAHCLAWAIPLLMTAIYLESMGPERFPVTWANVLFAAVCCIASFLFHPAGMWMACREARWVGTRCLPLVLPLIAIILIVHSGGSFIPWWATAISVLVVVSIAWIIFAAAEHGFSHQTFLPSSRSPESWSWPGAIGLSAVSVVVVATVATFVMTSLARHQHPKPHSMPRQVRRLVVADSGQVWELEQTWKSARQWNDLFRDQVEPGHRTGRQLTGDGKSDSFVELDTTWSELDRVSLDRQPGVYSGHSGYQYFSGGYRYFSEIASNGQTISLYLRGNRIHLYDDVRGWFGTVTPKGLFRPHETPLGAFSKMNALDYYKGTSRQYRVLSGHRLLADQSGIYQLDIDAWNLRRLADIPTTAMTVWLPSDDQANASLWTRDKGTLHRFAITPQTKDQSLQSTDSELVKATHNYPLVNIEITPKGKWQVDWSDKTGRTAHHWVSAVGENSVVLVAEGPGLQRAYRFLHSDGSLGDAGELPPLEIEHTSTPSWAWLLLALHSLLGGVGAFLLARSRARSLRAQIVWAIIGLLIGVASWLAVIAIYARSVLEQCTACQRGRCIDSDRCEHCGADWDIPESNGIELIGPRGFAPAPAQHESV